MAETSTDPETEKKTSATREAFLEAGAKILAEVGPEKISLRAVAKRAKLSPMAPYRHFSSKEGLLAELARLGFRQLGRAVRNVCRDDVESIDADVFKAMAAAYIEFAERNPEVYRLMFAGIIPEFKDYPELKTDAEWSYQILQQAIEAMQRKRILKDENPRILAHHCWSVMHGFVNLSLDGVMNALSEESLADRFKPHVDLLVSGMLVEEK